MGSLHLVFLSLSLSPSSPPPPPPPPPGRGVAPPPEPGAPECGPAVGPVLPVSGPAAARRLEQALHPGVHHAHLLPRLLPAPHHRCGWGGRRDTLVHPLIISVLKLKIEKHFSIYKTWLTVILKRNELVTLLKSWPGYSRWIHRSCCEHIQRLLVEGHGGVRREH